MNTTNGKIAEQSRKALTEALLTVMKQYDFKEITVTQIAQEAHLSRKTFYRLFTDKEEILDCYLKDIVTSFYSLVEKKQIHHYWEVVQLYFDFWLERKPLLDLLKKNNLLFLFYEISNKYSMQVFCLVRSQKVADQFTGTLPYLLAYAVGGMTSMLLKWAEDDMKTPSETLILQLHKGFQSYNI